ncbi:Plant invertase/pectin methylesterase inhibitor superfamily protein [Euphorbia peplus]|nr:Plant invertase/pectin methylesterase inhibitor superfamily protein [Euphorbia peplus]
MEAKTHLLTFALTLFSLSSIAASTGTSTSTVAGTYKKYLKTACNTTTYPKLCYNSLSPYTSIIKTNDLTLSSVALNISLQCATTTSSLVYFVSKQQGLSKIEAQVIQDCLDEIGDSIDELKQSLDGLRSLNVNGSASGLRFEVSNVQTWVSAAITDEDTCLDGFDESRVKVRGLVKDKIRKVVLNLARVTSNALALINKLHFS